MTGDIQPLKHGMTTDELLAAWKRRLPNTEPTDNQLSCFAIGIEVGRATDAQDTHLIAAAVRAGERERCANAAEKFLTSGRSPLGRAVAAAIRASTMPEN